MRPIKQRIDEAKRESESLDIDPSDVAHMHHVATLVGQICAIAAEFGSRNGGKKVFDAVFLLSTALATMARGAVQARPGDDAVLDELAFSAAYGEEVGKMLVDAGVIHPVESGTAS